MLRVVISDGWSVPANLYVAPIAASGERKSPLLRLATGGLREALDELRRRHAYRDLDADKAEVYRAQAKRAADRCRQARTVET